MENYLLLLKKYVKPSKWAEIQEVCISIKDSSMLKLLTFKTKRWYRVYYLTIIYKCNIKEFHSIEKNEKEIFEKNIASINRFLFTNSNGDPLTVEKQNLG